MRGQAPPAGLRVWLGDEVPFFILNVIWAMLLPKPAVRRTHEDVALMLTLRLNTSLLCDMPDTLGKGPLELSEGGCQVDVL
jgi:hypothetical protein